MIARLNDAERGSAAWQKVRAVLLERLARYRTQVEMPEKTDAERLALCWRIKELKELLVIEEPEKRTEPVRLPDGHGF